MLLELRYINDLLDIFQEKQRVCLYGNRTETAGIQKFLSLYGHKVEFVLDDQEAEGIYTIDQVEELQNLFVIICKTNYLPSCEKLEARGLRLVKDYFVLGKNRYANVFEKFPLDANIGYTYTTRDSNQYKTGVTVFGNPNHKNAFKIITVGSSTSDSKSFGWKCWSEGLYEYLSQENLFGEVVLYSAGTSGYRSSQELMKLQRDLLEYQPDLVISLSGINDIGHMPYPFVQGYTQEIFSKLDLSNVQDMNRLHSVDGIYYGEKRTSSNAEIWCNHIRMMHALCEEFGTKFLCFLEPMIGGGQ